jgi:hypothetical protein
MEILGQLRDAESSVPRAMNIGREPGKVRNGSNAPELRNLTEVT